MPHKYFIVEVISKELLEKENWQDEPRIKVTLIARCNGVEREYVTYFRQKEFEEAEKQGYFVA